MKCWIFWPTENVAGRSVEGCDKGVKVGCERGDGSSGEDRRSVGDFGSCWEILRVVGSFWKYMAKGFGVGY